MNLAFQDRFLPFVWEGSKRHSLRRGERWRAGMTANITARSRTAKRFKLIKHSDGSEVETQTVGQFKLFDAPVHKVEPVKLQLEEDPEAKMIGVYIGLGECDPLSQADANSFFWQDGFRENDKSPIEQAIDHWYLKVDTAGEWEGQIVHFDYTRRSEVADLTHQPYKANLVTHRDAP